MTKQSKNNIPTDRAPANVLRVSNTRIRQERRIRWTCGLPASQAALIAALVYGEAV